MSDDDRDQDIDIESDVSFHSVHLIINISRSA